MSILPGIERITKLLYDVPTPWRAIHVAGTNGKGSVCAYISAMLDVYNRSAYRSLRRDPPLRHGRFTSPHLVHYFDGITINQQPGDRTRLSDLLASMREKQKLLGIGVSEFELLTATAFAAFTEPAKSQPALDVAVIECGMGGQDDATNVFGLPWRDGDRPAPLVTAFTKIGLDHQDFLGSNLGEIARNKAGIMRPETPVVFDTSNDADVITLLSEQAGGRCRHVNDDPVDILTRHAAVPALLQSSEAHYKDDRGSRGTAASNLVAESEDVFRDILLANNTLLSHTLHNVSLAFKATWAALQGSARIDQESTRVPREEQVHLLKMGQSMLHIHESVSFPGRLQSLSLEPLTGRKSPILLDGAHNEQSAQVLSGAVELTQRKVGAPVTWVIAASSTKDVRSILKHVLADGDVIYAVEFGPVEHMPWVKPIPSADILQAANSVASVQGFARGRDVLQALQHASTSANEGPLVVAGSLYLAGDVLRLLEDVAQQESSSM